MEQGSLWSKVHCGARFTLWSKVHSVEQGSLCGARFHSVEWKDLVTHLVFCKTDTFPCSY